LAEAFARWIHRLSMHAKNEEISRIEYLYVELNS
jgi:hypothetical protein